jgi:hypothetical protein
MRRRTPALVMRCALALLLLLAIPLAAAGTREDPEVPDPAGDASPPVGCSDLTAVWAERGTDGAITIGAAVASCMEPPALPAAYWSIDFETSAGQYYIYADRDVEQGWGFWHGRMENGTPAEHLRAPLTFTPGSPAILSMAYPLEVAKLERGGELRFIQVVAGAYTSFQDATRFDEATPSRTLQAPDDVGEGATSASARAPGPAVILLLLAVALVALTASRPGS